MEIILTDIQLLALLICAILSYVAWKCRVPAVSVIPAIGFFIIGFDIYEASSDLLILGLFFTVAVVQFILAFNHSSGGH